MTRCLYSPRCREGIFSETRLPVLVGYKEAGGPQREEPPAGIVGPLAVHPGLLASALFLVGLGRPPPGGRFAQDAPGHPPPADSCTHSRINACAEEVFLGAPSTDDARCGSTALQTAVE
jgi:hypothetical protein